jgi:Domain of unknown function (DUF4383)
MSSQRTLVASDSVIACGRRRTHRTAASLGWVAALLPRAEGMVWSTEVASCLAEAADPGERRRYLRSYRRSVPQLVWTSWTPQVRQVWPAPVTGATRVTWQGLDMTMVTPEDKFGIKMGADNMPRTTEQSYSLMAGALYVVGGILGLFLTGFATFTEMTNQSLGIFMVNPFHNIVHLGLGTFWLLAAFALTPAGTEGLNIALGVVCALATVLGFLGLFSLLSIPAGVSADNFLHLITALATVIFGCGLSKAASGQPATA